MTRAPSPLLVKPAGSHGRVSSVSPESAGWTYVGFELYRLRPGEQAGGETLGREACLVFVSGRGNVTAGSQDFGEIGERPTPFDGKPWSVYVPAGSNWSVSATEELELAVCSAPGNADARPARIIAPANLGQEVRGIGSNMRTVTNILPETDPGADSLLVVEVITPGGHTSSYPPHKHDRDALPAESLLEETYYHRIRPSQGFAFQRVYTDRGPDGTRSLDEAVTVEDGDVVLVPEGYHPCAAIHGYDLYYLNVMAGPQRCWRFQNDAQHAWLLQQ